MSTHNICFYGEIGKKLTKNYHQILLLNNASMLSHVVGYMLKRIWGSLDTDLLQF